MLGRFLFTVLITGLRAATVEDELFYDLPQLFHLDDYERCLSNSGVYCMGEFDLLPHKNEPLLEYIEKYSADKYHFNRSHIHRAYCVTTRCARGPATEEASFEQCVQNHTRERYGLDSKLRKLVYCKSRSSQTAPDSVDLTVATAAAALVLLNLIATAYDYFRNQNDKPNRYLITWSLISNWNRLTADYADGDQKLAALKPLHGVKTLTLVCIMLAHTVMAFHMIYLLNPHFLEKNSHHPASAYLQNGTCAVHTFVLASSFLLTYSLLISEDKNPKEKLNVRLLPKILVHRYIRFLTVDMQLHVVCCAVVLSLGRNTRRALLALGALLAVAVAANFAAIYHFELRSIATLMFPEYIRVQFESERSFKWLYVAPWDALPAALLGALLAHVHAADWGGRKPGDSLIVRILYRLSVPLMVGWVQAGYWMKNSTDPVLSALYATFDRPIFCSIVAFAIFGFINKFDSLYWKFLSWRGWEILGRMSLTAYLVHWLTTLTLVGSLDFLAPLSIINIGGYWLCTVVLTYMISVPLHLFVELPIHRFLRVIFS
ncbi:uncharacterized protein LOC101744376 [Bombyx mori]|uniref:Acyltransferase 3 domain-containing protein n=1 Tax=Bombyx mori TaxID=7091 RepID=A0A8R2C763_BOMMO|nr:uncharacterized protein LOC101744376 [Bombyx mori]